MQAVTTLPGATFDDTPLAICRLVGHVRAEIVLSIERALSDAGVQLRFSQFLALKRLGDDGPMAPGELARILNYNPGALTRLLDKLEHRGYLERVPDPIDRRALRLELTASGRAIHTQMIACVGAAVDHAFAEVTPAERRKLRGLLLTVWVHLREERERSAGA